MISAKILADSIADAAPRLTTIQVTCHRFILAECNAHRVFSRNWRSSRAVPTARMIEEARTNPARPVEYGENCAGMFSKAGLGSEIAAAADDAWLAAAHAAADAAERLSAIGLHKQWATRPLEPFLWAHGIISSTDWDNFFKLRLAADAQPEIRALAVAMRDALDASTPQQIERGMWHVPFADQQVCEFGDLTMVSAARCARVSYTGHDGKPTTVESDLALAGKLAESGHWSPFEHQATPGDGRGNFRGWVQARQVMEGRD